jgi:hypothetical protein
MVLDSCCLSPAYLCNKVVNVWDFKHHM